MRGLRLVTLAVFVGALGLAGFAVAETPDGCGGVGLDETLLPSGLYFHVGEQICYEAWLAINAPKCDMENAEVRFWRPDDTPPNPMNICGSPGGTSIISGLYIAQGAAAHILDCGSYPALDYTVRAEDIVIVEDIPTVVAYVCITGTQLVGPPSQPGQDAKAIPNFVLNPCIEVTKEACEYSKEGDEITYSICVRNCSDEAIPGTAVTIPTTLYNVVVSDPMLGGTLAGFPSELAPGQEVCLDFPYTVTSGDMSPLENTVTASGEDVTGFVVQDTATETVTLLDPSIDVTVECMTPQSPGGVSEFLVTIDNTGDVDLEITTNDPGEIGAFILDWDDPPYEHTVYRDCTPPEVCYDIEVYWAIPEAFCDLPNTGMVYAEDCCQCCEPCIDIYKQVNCDVSKVGDEVLYTIEIRNCGDVELTDVVVTDPHLSASPLAGFPSTLPPDGVWYSVDFPYTVEPGDDTGLAYPNAVMTNQARVEANGLCGDIPEAVSADSEIITVKLVHPDFTVDKVCVEDPLPSDATEAWYTVTITNTGDIPLDFTTDDGIGPMTINDGDMYTEDVSEDVVGAGAVCNKIIVTATIPSEFCDLENVYVDSAEACCELEGAYGCTPGYWKNQTECWECYTTSTPLCDVFTFPAGDLYDFFCTDGFTLHKALKFGGGDGLVGKARNLARHGVAALLNACDADVPYGMGPQGVIDMVNDALATEDPDEITSVKNQLAAWNERGCSQDAHCEPIDPEDMEVGGTIGMMGESFSSSKDLPTEHILETEMVAPREFSVRGVPNPASTSASIRYAVPMDSKVTVEILDVQGRLVSKLVDQHMPAGSHMVAWDGNGAPAGVYFCRIQCCDGKETMSKVIKVQ